MKDPESERNFWLALILSMAVMLAYPWFLRKINPPVTPKSAPITIAPTEPSAPVPKAPPVETAQTIDRRTPLYEISFSTQGGAISKLVYKGESQKAHLGSVAFFEAKDHAPGFSAVRLLHEETDMAQAVFQANEIDSKTIEFIYEKPGQYRITKRYELNPSRPVILLRLAVENLSASEKQFPFEMEYGLSYQDAYVEQTHDVEAVYFEEKVKNKKEAEIRKKGFLVSGEKIEWAGLIKKYFAVLIKPDWKILSQENSADGSMLSAELRFEPFAVTPGAKNTKTVLIYAGPQRYEMLQSLHVDFEQILSKGFFGLFKIWLLISLRFLYQFTQNYGWAIILLTCVLKLLFAPMTHMSYESMRKMQAVQPKMKSIQERYKNDPQKMNREVMELYRRNKVNPMGGCLPMLIQIPIFIAFYQVLSETIELKGAPFMYWIHDLAEPDKLFHLPFVIPFIGDSFNLLPFFMTGSMVWQQTLTPQASSSPEQAKMMQFMPLMMGVLFYRMPSGLVLYWFVNNMLTVAHQIIIKRMGAVVLHHEDRD